MKPRLLSLLAIAFLATALPARPLFDGKTLDGWTIVNNAPFSVKDGAIHVNRGTGWLRSNETFSDFVATFEFRILEEGANSGIFARTGPTSHADAKGYPNNGYQIQCIDSLAGQYPIATLIPYGAGPFKAEVDHDALQRAYRPAGQWQTIQIACLGASMRITLNGEVITRVSGIANPAGHLGLQAEGGLLEFRSIEVTPL